jgi:hypothetical protein
MTLNTRIPKHSNKTTLVAAAVALLVFAETVPAFAYSGSEHIRFPDQAYQLMNVMRRGPFYAEKARRLKPLGTFPPLTQRPPSVPASEEATWQRFITAALAAPAKLDNVRIDLTNPHRTTQDCGGVFAALPPPPGTSFAQCRAGEISFAPRRGWGDNPNECYLRRGYRFGGADQDPTSPMATPFFQELPSNYTGSALGVWATRPDDENSDSQMFIRPTNLFFLGNVKELAIQILDVGLLVVVAPIACLGALFAGEADQCISDSIEAAHGVNLVARLDDLVLYVEANTVGQKDITLPGASFPGLWHFINPRMPGRFNALSGMQLTRALNSNPDSFDASIVAVADLTGLTLNPFDSTGVERYGAFAENSLRTTSDWGSFSFAHVEFEPLDNLAQYGWSTFLGNGGARGLGWVLHAIGDAVQPHHTIGTLGWGHAVWEKYANLRWQTVLQENNLPAHYPNFLASLVHAYRYWKVMDAVPSTPNPNQMIETLIETIANDTRNLPFATEGRAFQSGISMDWFFDSDDGQAFVAYDTEQASLGDLMQRGIGASLAFLAKAAERVPTSTTVTACSCSQAGQARSGQDRNGNVVLAPNGGCLACGTGAFLDLPRWLDGRCVAVCPPDKPTAQGTTCVSTGACPPATPFFQNGACVAQCSAAFPVVVNYRECRAACPPGEVEDAARFCAPPRIGPACIGTVRSSDRCCEQRSLCAANTDCCSNSCNMDGICRGEIGQTCVIGNDCASGSCAGGICKVPPGGSCFNDNQCGDSCIDGLCCLPFDSGCSVAGVSCCGGLTCSGDTCKVSPGGACTQDNQCSQPGCIQGACCIPFGSACAVGGVGCCGGASCNGGICGFSS